MIRILFYFIFYINEWLHRSKLSLELKLLYGYLHKNYEKYPRLYNYLYIKIKAIHAVNMHIIDK